MNNLITKFKNFFPLFILLFFSNTILAQKGKDGARTVSAANRIYNRYTTLSQTAPAGSNTLVIGNIADLAAGAIGGGSNNPYTTAALSACDLLMIIKMQGATINTLDAAAYGTISNYNGVGSYELIEVGSVSGNTITIANGCSIINGYTVSPTERVQVVRIPRITNLTINAGASLTSRPWGNVANTGGIVAIETSGTTIINGSITVQGQGFRGGQLDNLTLNGSVNFVGTTSDLGAEKGESIVGFQADYDALGGRYCQGAPANGGGGGNGHNSGGGGGSNGDNGIAYNGLGIPSLATATWAASWNQEGGGFSTNTTSGGGRGGYSFASNNLDAAVTAPGNVGWGGDSRRIVGGRGGRPLSTASNTRVFFGGGGGAGDGNNNANQVGANGGGIIYLLSDGNISGTGVINCNGNNALPTIGGHNDAPGGAGGGGAAVVLTAGTLSGISISADGGTGGSQLITNNESEGPGGGGGGGYILTTTTSIIQGANGGANGTTLSTSMTEFIPNGATQGASGEIVNNALFPIYNLNVDLSVTISENTPVCLGDEKTYTIVVSNLSNCNSASNVTVTIPTPSGVTFTSNTVSNGSFLSPTWTIVTLNAGASETLTLSGNITATTLAAFNATASSASSECAISNNTTTISSSTVISITLLTSSSSTAICIGQTATLTATGATSYSWNPVALTGSSIAVTPTSSTIYTVIGTTGACSSTSTINLTVNPNPTVIAVASPTAICAGETTTISASGASSYTWNPGAISNTTITVSPSSTTVYTVEGIDATGCSNTQTINLIVNSSPTITVISSPTAICTGGSATLTASGASSYSWNPIALTGSSIVVTPTSTTIYTVIGTTGLCSTTSTIGLTVSANPTVNVISSSTTVCSGVSSTLSATGAFAYLWNPGAIIASSIVVTPTSTTIYTVTGGNIGGCIDTKTINLIVNSSPSITATASPTSVCSGATASLSAIGAISFTWNPGNINGASVTPTIFSTTQFTVIGVDAQGCVGTQTLNVNLNSCPTAVNDATNTAVNTTVISDAGLNDVNTIGGVFSNSQPNPGSGTLTMNPSTGQYTYTPATGFTGTTQATYTLCNGSPVVCSNATIIFTVYPNIIANSNTVITAANTSTNGNLITNDVIPTGVTINVSLTQPASTTGTIIVDPSTGQYTFTPNAAFTGTAQTTYTICNTTVNPSQCSTATIILQVGYPIAVSNTNTTIENTPVSGDAGINDGGATVSLNPVFTSSQPTTGSGTIVMNPSTGQYTYTPQAGFNGTTVVTYTLCNILSPPCSTTTITFTVFPTLIANPDIITTTPSVTTTGTLLANDGGITNGGTYTVGVTQPSPASGTITINASTGQYTFIPNPAFVGTTSTTYTVCNTAVNPGVCSTSTILIQVGNLPVAVSNTNITIENTPITGDAGIDDIGTDGALNPSFTVGQPTAGTGTITMNTTTGQYTFTPQAGFNGTTVATYTLCNLLSPPCSTTTITFTVFPTLVANPDVVATTPSLTSNGVLLGNDGGVVAGGIYTVSLTQPSITTGTITVNPTTGQYTFVPNPSFTGTASTTYTVCNITVTPSVCSSATILIQVGNLPVAAADGTATILNTTVVGDASVNDAGVLISLNPIFTNAQPLAGTGTLTMDPATGQYTFTPATGFTGTTTATYTLCNLTSPPCSTTSITFTVYPNLVAIPNIINTTPSVTANGNLVTNDVGITAGANYFVSVTQLAPTTGTITINSATGQFTFIPNPSFTGSVNTTYTICNVSVNPSQCSNTTITIIVGNTALAVNDGTTTLINVPVSGNVGNNDSGTATGTFVIVSQPTNGSVAIDPSTGQYTFTPNTGFSGTTTATYQLCNVLSPPCSTATITFTVFPAIVTNSDVISTTPNTTTNGNILTNDILPNGATVSVSITQLTPVTGTLLIDPTTGQYTFTPNAAFTGSTTTTYTVCNTSINPQNCSTNTIVILVGNVPLAVNDATLTLINTPVIGNAESNDSGGGISLNPVFTAGQPTPGSGTLIMNPSTGQFTYTPAAGFTGTTIATYTLCNLSSPPCSTASITFTVYPNLVAINNTVITTPSISTTGTLTANDLGLVPNGTYSTTVTQLNPTTGTILINPVTGQYTFAPNPSFTGTAQTTYTVCQFVPTSTIALQCSNATITINVSSLPSAINDGTVTLINTPVTANTGLNDSGTIGGIFTSGQPIAGTGSLTMNPSTGQYTFTPATGFTGTTAVTYTLCNSASPPCSIATITFIVYPNLVAINDPISTTPSVSVNGTLTVNDIGLAVNGTYSTSVTQLNPTTGTILINPVTGQYTFTPNASFTGSAQTTYTICQFVPPSTIALQCSTATITINLITTVLAVNDATTTIVNTPVSGNLGVNDLNTGGGTFSITSQPSNGTITINASTGGYTFTPNSGFTGVTTATYIVCNVPTTNCSTATITFSVYPTLIAINDAIITAPSTIINGSLTLNDIGISTNPGGIYSVTVTQPSTTTGTIAINSTTGQYTFFPNPGFTGTVTTTYTICNLSVNPTQCSTATITIVVDQIPIIGVAKSVSTPTYNADGTIILNYKITLKNYGTVALTNISLADNLSNTFPNPSTYTIINSPLITSTLGTQLTINNLFSGASSNSVITVPATSSLAVGRTDTVTFSVKISTNGFTGSFNNFAIISANSNSIIIVDTSATGNNPDTNNNNNPLDDDGPTVFNPEFVKIGLAKFASKVEGDGAGCNTITFKFTIKNYLNVPVYNISLIDNLDNTFINPATYTVISSPVSINNLLTTNALYSGNGGNSNLLSSTNSLTANGVDTIIIKVRFCSNGGATTYSNSASIAGNSLPSGLGAPGNDLSTNGLNPDPNGNNNPSDIDENIPSIFSGVDLTLIVPEGINPNDVNGNQTWIIKGIENYPDNVLSIYNRWGNLVYEKNGYTNAEAWNGTANSNIPKFGTNSLPQGTYYYVIEFKNSEQPVLKGFVILQY